MVLLEGSYACIPNECGIFSRRLEERDWNSCAKEVLYTKVYTTKYILNK